ncbi:MAG: two component transcriptional regulator, LuxR family [Proteobacteria bacterium]|nr:two component transcriptional regulator, LuxR family [Pseudomonadota bacterium]
MLKFLVVEDHPLVREGICRLLNQISDEVEILEAANANAAQAVLAQREDLDLILMDLAMPGLDGLAALPLLRSQYPSIPVAILSAYDDPPTVSRAMNNGASGFITKSSSGEEILAALQDILEGQIVVPGNSNKARLGQVPERAVSNGSVKPSEIGLSQRQAEVLALIIKGLTNREIGRQLGLTEGTVKVHATAVFKVLGVGSRTEAIVASNSYKIDFNNVF